MALYFAWEFVTTLSLSHRFGVETRVKEIYLVQLINCQLKFPAI